MSETEKAAESMVLMEDFARQTEVRMEKLVSLEQEIALLTEQITTKDDHLRQLSAQRNGLHAKYQSIRNAHQDAVMKYMADFIETMARDGQS
jgi:uncharacterized protein (DUF3084 family)